MNAQPNKTYAVKTQRTRNKQHAATPLGNLLNKYEISLSRLSYWLGQKGLTFSSTATLSRHVRGKSGPGFALQLNEQIADSLQTYLTTELGLPKSEVDADLSQVFTQGEYKPMISRRIALTDAECKYFGFEAEVEGKMTLIDPFKNAPATREEVYFPAEYRAIYDRVLDAIKYRHFIAVLGPIGSGKTTLRAMVEDQISRDANLKVIWPEFFDQAKISAYEIARSILRECEAPVPGRAAALGKAVTKKLQSITQNGQRAAIAFDECHKMHKTTIRSLKNFHEMSSGGFQKYLGIVLFGWPQFESMLMDPEFQEIYERLDVVEMPEFAGKLAAGYLEHRFKLIGLKAENYFDKEAIDYIAQNADTPLQLGNLANKALRISMKDFGEKKVLGAAIRTKMFFDSPKEQGFRKR